MIDFFQHPMVLNGSKALVLLALAFLATTIMRKTRSTAAQRGLVWSAAMLALLLLPLFSKNLPTWHIGITQTFKPIGTLLHASTITAHTIRAKVGKASSLGNDGRTASTEANPQTLTAIPLLPSGVQSDLSTRSNVIDVIFTIWLIGFIGILTTTVLGWFSLLRLRLRARECHEDQVLVDLQEVRKALGIQRNIRLLMSNRREIPMTWGVFHPIIHLPTDARDWTAQERRAVLVHELAHVSRFDSAIQLLAQLVTAIYWYNPLVWIANRSLRAEQEASCDDTVLRHGTPAPIYAQHLAAIVSGRSALPWESAVALAAGRTGKLESRIRDILTSQRNRQASSSLLAGVTITSALAISIILGALHPLSSSLQAATPASTQDKTTVSDLNALQTTIINQSLQKVDTDRITRSTIEGMLGALDDPHAKYLSAKELASMQFQLEGVLFGIGAQLRMDEDRLLVVRPIPGSPALDAGIRSSDVIIAVDGTTTKNQSLADIVHQIRGPLGTAVQLSIERDGREQSITVTRGRIKLPTIHGLRGVVTTDGVSEPDLIGREGKIGYLQISHFGNHTPDELNARIAALRAKGMTAAIIDLRYCPGGSLESATQTADLFLDHGTIVSVQGRDGDRRTVSATPETHWNIPLVLLVNEATASAAEIVCGALQDHDRAIVLGTRTFGKASVQSLLHINEQLGAIRLTTARYFPPNGKSIDRTTTSEDWGINATEGFFVPSNDDDATLQQRLQGTRPIDNPPLKIERVTVSEIKRLLSDRQLAAALEAAENRVATNTFKPVGGSRYALESYVRQQEIKAQHATLIEKLTEIQTAVGSLVEDAN